MNATILLCIVISIFHFHICTSKPDPDTDFSKLVKTTAFVDKTLLMKEILQHDHVIITAPYNFGKSTNVDMIRRFLEIVVNDEGQPLDNMEGDFTGNEIEKAEEEMTQNFRLFKNHNLNIYQDREYFYKHCGKYPIIFINFKFSENVFNNVYDPFRVAVHRTFREHSYLIKTSEGKSDWVEEWLEIFSVDMFIKYWDKEKYKQISKEEIEDSFVFLSEVLHIYFSQRPIVLIDDIDSLISNEIIHSNATVGKTIHFITVLITKMSKPNENIEKCFIHSCDQGLAKILTNMINTLKHYRYLGDHNFSAFYGFTEDEVKELLHRFEVSEKLSEIEKWFGGYAVLNKSLTIYNPGSIESYLKNSELKSYWTEPALMNKVKGVVNNNTCEKLEKLLNNEIVSVEKVRKTGIEHILRLRNLKHEVNSENNKEDTSLFFEILCDFGYFNTLPLDNTLRADSFRLQIPNKEVRQEIENIVNEYC